VSVRVLAPGAFTTVQDLGRPGLGAHGVPPSGAMDQLSLRATNLLVGNPEDAAGLEITMTGPELLFEEDRVIAIAGAPFDVRLNREQVEPGRSFVVPGGATLTIGRTRTGARSYLAVRGGIDVPPVLGSRSTFVPAGFGGAGGRPLASGAVLAIGSAKDSPLRTLAQAALPVPGREAVLRAVPGPQEEPFTPKAVAAFFGAAWRVSTRSDRVGVRLEGEPIEAAGSSELDPEGVVTGTVQVPADGSPIVLGPDRPATGGYVKIATVVTADLPLLAQARPGDTLRFAAASVSEGRAAWRERLRALREGIEEVR
jgi:biotin-dependent carboxylase-like uncharacterized protein